MSREQVYGFPCVENPHDFEPDVESCTPEEIAFHQQAKVRWDAGERDVRGARCHFEGDIHVVSTSWGIGINTVDWDDN